jgi:hypothetical protein
MRLSALRSPRLFVRERLKSLAWWWSQSSDAKRAARTFFYFVIAGLDPAIHAAPRLAESHSHRLIRRISAWTTGSSPVVTMGENILRRDSMAKNLTPEDFQKRFDAATAAAQREYCEILEFWRACRRKACRRAKACAGDALSCLKRGFTQVPDEACERALARVIAATAADADRPTQLARQMSPQSFYLWSLKAEQQPKQAYTVG